MRARIDCKHSCWRLQIDELLVAIWKQIIRTMANIRCTLHTRRAPVTEVHTSIIIWVQVRPHALNRSILPINPIVRASYLIPSVKDLKSIRVDAERQWVPNIAKGTTDPRVEFI